MTRKEAGAGHPVGRRRRIVVAVTGASGSAYALRLLELLMERDDLFVDSIFSENGRKIALQELGSGTGIFKMGSRIHDDSRLEDELSSGSTRWDAMAIVPCSMTTVGRLACGLGDTLISRVASVALKERRRLIVVPRETPLSGIHLANLKTISDAGAVVLPACPSFYSGQEDFASLVDSVVLRILDHLGVESGEMDNLRWDRQ